MPKIDFSDSDSLCRWVAERSPACLLSFSGGKDSIGAWIQCRRFFESVHLVYMYLVPGLEIEEETVAYFEQAMDTRILRLPHPSLYRLLYNQTMQAPENLAFIEAAIADGRLTMFDYDDVFMVAMKAFGLPDDTYTAVGVRAVDSPNRWSAIKQYGAVNENRRSFYPIYDWRKDRLLDEIRDSGLSLPPEYRLFGRSFDGIDYRFLQPLREHRPADYARILEWFPLAELELKRIEYRSAYYGEIQL